MYVLAMHTRTAHARASKSGQRIGRLVDIGRRLSSVDFLVFALGTNDIFTQCVVPVAEQSEKTADSVMEVSRGVQRCMSYFQDYVAHVTEF